MKNSMSNSMSVLAMLALMAVSAPAAFAEQGNCGNQVDSGDNPNGEGNTCGDDTGTDMGWDSSEGWGNTTFAAFEGGVFSQNGAAAEGDYTIALTKNTKFEEGFATVLQTSNGPGVGISGGSVFTEGLGMSGALSFGTGSSVAKTGVIGEMNGYVAAIVGGE